MKRRTLNCITCLLFALGLIGRIMLTGLLEVQQQSFRAPATLASSRNSNFSNITNTPVVSSSVGNTSASMPFQWVGELNDITLTLKAAARSYAEANFVNNKDSSYKLTATSNPHGFGSNVLLIARAYAVSVHMGRSLVTKTNSMSYNCASNAGYQCFFNTSAVLLADNTAVRPSGAICEQEWKQNETLRDSSGFPTFYSNRSSLCTNVPFIPGRMYSGPNITFPNVGFMGTLAAMTQLSTCVLWQLTDETAEKVAEAKAHLALKRPYVGLHVRRGDKKEGAKKPPVMEYMERAVSYLSEFQTVFLASDDEKTLTEARQAVNALNMTDVDIQVLPSFLGRNLTTAAATNLWQKSAEERFAETTDLITEMEILADANVFVGTGTSNVGCVVAALRACRGYKAESSLTMDRSWEQQISYIRPRTK